LLILARIDRDEPLCEQVPRTAEIAAGYTERLVVDLKLPLDALQRPARGLVAAARQLCGCIELLQLCQHTLRLRPLRAYRTGVSPGYGGPDEACQEQAN
jgi:hypothetical protein